MHWKDPEFKCCVSQIHSIRCSVELLENRVSPPAHCAMSDIFSATAYSRSRSSSLSEITLSTKISASLMLSLVISSFSSLLTVSPPWSMLITQRVEGMVSRAVQDQ
jgi:hypothetical protein